MTVSTRCRLAAVPAFAAACLLYFYTGLEVMIAIHHEGWLDSDNRGMTPLRTALSLVAPALLGALATILLWSATRVRKRRLALYVCFATACLLVTGGFWTTATFLLAHAYLVPGQIEFAFPIVLLLFGFGGCGLGGSIPLVRRLSDERG